MRWVKVCVAAFALACVARASAGFELLRVNGDPCDNGSRNLAWANVSAPVDLRFLPGDLQGLGSEARVRWNERVASFRFLSGAGERCNFGDGVVTLGFATTACNERSLDDALGITVSRWRADGQLLDAEITFNPNATALNDDAVFLEVAMHELGHVLGLDHSDACGASGAGTLMKTVLYLSAPRLQGPQDDDVAGANFIYDTGGSDGSDGSVPEGVNSCAVTAPDAGLVPALPFACWPVLLAVCRLQRRLRARRHPRGSTVDEARSVV